MLVVVATVLLLATETHSTVCQSAEKNLRQAKGEISSPTPNQSGICSWKVRVPEDSQIVFYFKFYEIESCSDGSYPLSDNCAGCTRIELRNSSHKPPWHTFCGYKPIPPEPLSIGTSTFFVNFKLKAGDTKSWFAAEYETWPSHRKGLGGRSAFRVTVEALRSCLKPSTVQEMNLFIKWHITCLAKWSYMELGIDLVTTSTAEISSPLFPGKYPKNSRFRWLVVSPSGYRVKIKFSKFDLNYCSECRCDFLEVRDGTTPESQLLGKYCSNPGTLYTSGNSVSIEFVASMESSCSNGFKATVSREIKLYVVVVPCILGIFLLSLVVAILVVKWRRRRLSPSGNGAPVVQMSLLNEDDNLSAAQLSDAGPHIEASLPVYRPTTQKIRR
ncbi:Tolloid-like protein 2 [Stylophora pistillata]|uniref:Tolloid-like protein 2 n=1 Tax=Stylophora pistillata TaxID=50429 RepID=A0A2B4SHI0_STYPI|nr:Tolloid-like protein 2 [Stylophora pistillata]